MPLPTFLPKFTQTININWSFATVLKIAITTISIVIFALTAVILYRPFPTPQINFALISNSSPVNTTLTWYTQTPAQGCVYILEFPLRRFCDVQAKPVTNHYVNLTHLLPQRNYNLLIQTGLSFARFPLPAKFISEQVPSLPNPAYGRIVSADGKPVPFATVIVFTKAGPTSTLTTDQGYWTLDLRGQYPTLNTLKLHIAWGKYYLTDFKLGLNHYQPAPDITLKPSFNHQ